MCNGRIAAFFDRQHPAFHFIFIGSAKRQIYRAAVLRHFANYNRLIFLMQAACLGIHLFGETVLCVAVFCNDKKPGCVHIQAVYKAYLVAFTLIKHFFHNAVCNRMTGLAFGRVDNHARLFVNDQKVAVLINDGNRDVLRWKITFFLGKQDADDISLGGSYPPLHIAAVQ